MKKTTKKKKPGKAGRPPMEKGNERQIVFTLRVSRKELKAWRNAAGKSGMSLASWLLAPRREGK